MIVRFETENFYEDPMSNEKLFATSNTILKVVFCKTKTLQYLALCAFIGTNQNSPSL